MLTCRINIHHNIVSYLEYSNIQIQHHDSWFEVGVEVEKFDDKLVWRTCWSKCGLNTQSCRRFIWTPKFKCSQKLSCYCICLPDPAWKLYWQEPVVEKDAGKPENNCSFTFLFWHLILIDYHHTICHFHTNFQIHFYGYALLLHKPKLIYC